jgi:hypothetical protein
MLQPALVAVTFEIKRAWSEPGAEYLEVSPKKCQQSG